MSFSPGINAASEASEPMLFGAPTCAVCATELAWGGKGRRPKYCSKACSSKADRAREKEKRTRALVEAAETTRGEIRLPDGLVDDPAAAELLTLGEELAAADRLLLHRLDRAARDTDPALAHKALAAVLDTADAVTRRHRELVERLRAGHPALADPSAQPTAGPGESPRGEIATVRQVASGTGDARSATAPAPSAVTAGPGAADASAGESLRGETTAAQGTLEAVGAARAAGLSSRDEKTPAVPPGNRAPVAPREETPTAAAAAGPAPVAPRGENATGGAAAVGPAAALDVLLRPAAPITPASAPAPSPAPAAPDGVPVPDLALAAAAGRTPPTLRGLGDPLRDYALGDGLVHLTWPGRSDAQALEQRGRLAGWTEVYDEFGNWIALVSGRPVVDAADNVPLLSANPADALTLLRLALDQGLAADTPARPTARANG
ncbi:hypothetical protein ACFC26_12990 [Kitasatospora purpeofusca]|uniref:hypothetical protein n=1 Tax=Kitasatospora purpeofusca TaxID=67352 RepID=UPI0035DE312A